MLVPASFCWCCVHAAICSRMVFSLRSSLNDLPVFQQQEWTCVTHFLFFSLGRSQTLEAVSDWLIGVAGFRMQITFEVEVTRVNSCVELGG